MFSVTLFFDNPISANATEEEIQYVREVAFERIREACNMLQLNLQYMSNYVYYQIMNIIIDPQSLCKFIVNFSKFLHK